jgi:ketosteroid isomerase-like protein
VSEADIEVMRRGFVALSEQGIEGLIPMIDPEWETTTPPGLAAEPDTYRGHEGVRRYWSSFEEVMDDIRFEPQQMTALGDEVLVELIVRARGKTTGIEVEQHLWQVWRLRDGKAIRVDSYATEEEAVAAHGGT